jgi:hypothetical protein
MNEYEEFYTFDDPVPINGLFLYPVQMRQYIYFYENIGVLLFNKNRIPDPQIISMSYLAFIYYISWQNNVFLKMLENLLYLCFRLDKEKYEIDFNADKKNKPCININEKNTKNKWQLSYKDFREIRKIICDQNLVEFPDEKIDPKLEAVLLEAQALKNKLEGNLKIISLEDQMVSVVINSSFTFESIYSLPIRKFVKILERKNKEMHYLIYKTASLSGMVEFKEKIVHYLYDDGRGKYDEFFTDYDEYKGKVSQVTDMNKGGK